MPLQTQLLFRRYAISSYAGSAEMGTDAATGMRMPLQTQLFGGSVKMTHAVIANIGKTATSGMRRQTQLLSGSAAVSDSVNAHMGTTAISGM